MISECGNTQMIYTEIFIKFLLQNDKWQPLQNQNKHILQQKNVVVGKNLPYETQHHIPMFGILFSIWCCMVLLLSYFLWSFAAISSLEYDCLE